MFLSLPDTFRHQRIRKQLTRKQPQVNYLSESPIALQQLIDEIPSGISILDMDRKIILMNRALEAMTGFSSSAARGLPCYQVLRSGICIHKCPLREENKRFESIFVESDIINRDRQRIPVNINIASLKNLQDQVVGYLETVADLRAIRELDAKISHAYSFSSIIGRSPQMEKIYQIMPVLAQSDSSVLITGETGTGKDLVAEALHQASNRSKGQFIKVNCGALPETLLESELFGHQKGAFTGAVENKPGRFRLAHNGTLFLTEIGDLPLPLQVKLLTFLDDQVIYPLGSTKGFQANVRVIAGTHRNLEQMVRQGLFRSDLLFRLNVVHIHLPPLRSREGDLELLLDHFVRTLNLRFQKKISGVSKTTLQLLRQYSFPGNVRELRNIIEYAANICDRGQIEPEDLPTYILDIKNDPSPGVDPDLPQHIGDQVEKSLPPHPENHESWSSVERQLIMNALSESGGRRNETAGKLGWARSTLWRKMKHYHMN